MTARAGSRPVVPDGKRYEALIKPPVGATKLSLRAKVVDVDGSESLRR